MVKFTKTISKGSRFNQIYIPKSMESLIEVGDEVEVKLLKKCIKLYHSKGIGKLSEFKEKLIKEIFSYINEIADADYIFVVGSFLTEKINYNDIDIVLISSKKNIEESVYNKLIDKFNLRFHIIAMNEKRFKHLLNICPLTRAMLSKFVSNKPITIPKEKAIDSKHIQFLLMMPQDLLKIKLGSRTFYDNIRRLITIESFFKDEYLEMDEINENLKKLIGSRLYGRLKNNEEVEDNAFRYLRRVIKNKLTIIKKLIALGN